MLKTLYQRIVPQLLTRSVQTSAAKQPNFGLMVPVITPFKQNGDVDLDGLRKYINYLVKNGIRSVYVNGTTGEFPSLTVEERKSVQAVYLDYGRSHGLEHVIVHCGSSCLREAVELAKHAHANGADRIAAIAPFYTPPRTVDALIDYCATVSNAAPGAAFYYYHIPPLTKCTVPLRDFLTAADRQLPALEGLKFSDNDLPLLAWAVHYGAPSSHARDAKYVTGRYVVLPGSQELSLAKLAHGALHDGIGTQFNFMPAIFRALRDAFESGDHITAARLQLRVNQNAQIVNRFADYGSFATLRDIVLLLGLDLGPPRSPFKRLSQARLDLLHNELKASGFFEFSAKP